MLRHRSIVLFAVLAALLVAATGCSSFFYGTMEKFGYEKRDILSKRVSAARETQVETKEQFQSALEQFQAVVGHGANAKLEDQYNTLKDEYDRCEEKAGEVHKRIDDVESVAEALFDEWDNELDKYTDKNLRRQSEDQLKKTKVRYAELIKSMQDVEKRIDPVLNAFRDRVLFLKHNLNAQAIASLQGDLNSLQTDVSGLIVEMNASIEMANKFLAEMETTP